MLLSVIIFFWNTMKGLADPMNYFLIDTPKLLLKKTNISWTTPSVVFNSFTQLHWKIFTRDPTIILFFQRGWRDSPDQRGVGSNPEDKNLPGLSLRSWDFNSYFRIYFHLFFFLSVVWSILQSIQLTKWGVVPMDGNCGTLSAEKAKAPFPAWGIVWSISRRVFEI